jgi:hypothetical protein
MSQRPTPATIKLSDLSLVLHVAKLRAATGGRTCLLAVTTPAPIILIDCGRQGSQRRDAMRSGLCACNVMPMQRGHIAKLIGRVKCRHGLREVRATWGIGPKALLAEPRYVLCGGAA